MDNPENNNTPTSMRKKVVGALAVGSLTLVFGFAVIKIIDNGFERLNDSFSDFSEAVKNLREASEAAADESQKALEALEAATPAILEDFDTLQQRIDERAP